MVKSTQKSEAQNFTLAHENQQLEGDELSKEVEQLKDYINQVEEEKNQLIHERE